MTHRMQISEFSILPEAKAALAVQANGSLTRQI